MRRHLFFVFILFQLSGFSQNVVYEKSKVIDSIQVLNSTDTFTLYLPEKFNKNELSAIVFIFEPAARGKVGIQPFIEAAEKYNYILVCSNNCKNGPYDDNFDRIDRLFETVFNTFSIDEKLIYTAGFSGGSRLATTVAVLTKQVQGVIGCGAGFSSNRPHLPTNETFSYVGLVGDEDMNYQEMFIVKGLCSKFKIDHELYTYEDKHSWPPSEQILRAFDWLELQAYKRGIKPVNKKIISDAFYSNYETANKLETENKLELAVWEYERILRNFSRHFNLDTILPKIKVLKKDKHYKNEVKTRERIKDEESKVLDIFFAKFEAELENEKSKDNYKWWTREYKKIKDKYLLSENLYTKKMGERISYSLFAMAIETARNQQRLKNMGKVQYCLKLNTALFPERPFTFFRLAMHYALLKDETQMLENLKMAIDKGFTHKDYILNTEEFSNYLNNKEFKALVDTI